MKKYTLKSLALGAILSSNYAYASSVSFPGMYNDPYGNELKISTNHEGDPGSFGTIVADEDNIVIQVNQFGRIYVENGMSAIDQTTDTNTCYLRNIRCLEASDDSIMLGRADVDSFVRSLVTVEGRDICFNVSIDIALAQFTQSFKIQNGLMALKVPFSGAYIDQLGNLLITKEVDLALEASQLFGAVSHNNGDIFFEFGNPGKMIWMEKRKSDDFYNMRNVSLLESSEGSMRLQVSDLALLSGTDYGLPVEITQDGNDLLVEVVLAAYNQTFRVRHGKVLLGLK